MMKIWNPWRGCIKCSEGCKFCYVYKGDYKKKIDTSNIIKTDDFDLPIQKNKKGEYKIKSGQKIYVYFQSDFLIKEAALWREDCWKMMKERSDLYFIFLTKRIDRFLDCIPPDWESGYENIEIGVSVSTQENVDEKISILSNLPIKYKDIICQPLIEKITLTKYLDKINLVVVGGESDYSARSLDYDWVLSIREECLEHDVPFEFRQTGTYIIKDGTKHQIVIKDQGRVARELMINSR